MSTFDQDEASVQSNQPEEYYDIVLSTGVTYHIASGNRDLLVGATIYTAIPAARGALAISKVDGNTGTNLELSLPVNHPFIQRCFQYGVPPRQTTVTAWRRQKRSLVSEQMWVGLVTSIACSGNIAKLLIPARIVENAQRYLPTVTTAPTCPYILYDAMCQVARTSFVVTTTAILVEGRAVLVDMGDAAKVGNNWSLGGEIVHSTGERRSIMLQKDLDPSTTTLSKLSMTEVIPELKTGDTISIYAGCDHTIQTCKTKFAQHHRFGGYPDAALVNPFMLGSSGLQGA